MLHTLFRRLGLVLMIACVLCMSRAATADSTFIYNGHTYEIVKTAQTWADAAADAVGRQKNGVSGALVRIDTAAENAAIYSQVSAAISSSEYSSTKASDGGGGSYVWIGATDRVSEGVWLWDGNNDGVGDQFWSGGAGGSSVGGLYGNWGTVGGVQHEPDNYNSIQNAAGLSLNGWPTSDQHLGSASQWNDVNEGNSLYYVVEYAAVPEPATASLLVVAALLMAFRLFGRRR
jgi:hypothetical protein